jgi:hypothetical protein
VEAGADGHVPVEAGPSDAGAEAEADAGAGPEVEGVVQDSGPFVFLDVPFICGGKPCLPSTHYCLHVLPEGGLTPEAGDISDQCLPIPAVCASTLTCQCLETVAPCDAGVEGEGCVEGAGLEVSCPAGT